MDRDVTAFRERFNAYKNGKSVSEIYDAGLPKYAGGTSGLTKAQEAALDELYEWGNSLGYDTMSIAGIGGNGLQESGLNYNAKSKSGYAGLLQNNKNIQQAIIEQYGDYSPASQRQYIHDWNTRAKWITKGKHSPHTATNSGRYKTKGYTSTDEASDAWMKLYERPVILDSNGKVIGYQEQDKRRAYTKLAYEYLNSKYGKPQIPAQEPSPYIAKPVSTAVRTTIPAEQTVPTYDPTISPYISGKPMVKLRPRVQLPNIIEVMEDSEWEPGFPGLKNGKLPTYENGKVPKSRRARAIYNSIDPRQAYPESYSDAAKMEANVRWKMAFGNPDQIEYERGQDIGSRVSDAAWRKRLGYDYDESILPAYDGGVRLPLEVEQEIPVDTTFLKDRIKRTEELMNYSRKYRNNKYIKLAKRVDQEALDALRKTYKTGQPVVVNEHAFNNRQWVGGGEVNATMSPLNVLQNYTIQYDPKTNTMKYYDTYDFNQYDWAVPGSPFKISGSIDLKPRKTK